MEWVKGSYDVEIFDRNGEVWVLLGVLNDGRAENMSSAFDVDSRSIHWHKLNASELSHSPE